MNDIVKGVLFDYNQPNLNGRIYPKSVMEKAIEDYNRKIKIEQRKQKLEKINKISNN